MNNQYFLISTSHLEDRIWFHDDDDFKVGMNLVAVAAYVCKITMLDFILMSNHVHFVLQASEEEALRFIHYFKLLYSKYVSTCRGKTKLLSRNSVDFRLLEDTESVMCAIAYVQMNCVAAGICVHPSQYRWGCGSAFFNPTAQDGERLGCMSLRAQFRLTHSRVPLPDYYSVSADGVISPSSYIAVKFVEGLFRTPNRLQYYLNKSSKARKRLSNDALPAFRDQVIFAGVKDLCLTLFRKDSTEQLSEDEKSDLLKQLRYRFSADITQLARVTGILYADVCRMLDSC